MPAATTTRSPKADSYANHRVVQTGEMDLDAEFIERAGERTDERSVRVS